MVLEEAMDMEEAEVEDTTVEATMDTVEVAEVTHLWAAVREVAVAATIPPSGPITIAAWV
jgi:hypothetical protein